MNSNRFFGVVAITFSVLFFGVAAFAHGGATGIVKQRMDVMVDISKAMKTIGAMVRGKTGFDSALIARSANAISQHADHIPSLFPDASNTGPSEALPIIWADWEGFLVINQEMKEGADALVSAAQSASSVAEIREPFGRIARTCSSCHEKFRLKKQ